VPRNWKVQKRSTQFSAAFLSGSLYEDAIEPTLNALHDVVPDYIVPYQYTGWTTINMIISNIPSKFIPPRVGTRFIFEK
jgi:7,8-dihydropterin-6-yl-methyl-4-(beta-D-ribofuranosyl)aminobenzene 5'-phosphate synthase